MALHLSCTCTFIRKTRRSDRENRLSTMRYESQWSEKRLDLFSIDSKIVLLRKKRGEHSESFALIAGADGIP
jgi:hypothetical protein